MNFTNAQKKRNNLLLKTENHFKDSTEEANNSFAGDSGFHHK